MLTPIPLSDCPGLIGLMLTADERGASFTLNGAQCVVTRIGNAVHLEAITSDFILSVVVPGWYTGEHGAPAYVAVVGEAHTCTGWLPLDSTDKLALIQRLPLSPVDRILCRLSI